MPRQVDHAQRRATIAAAFRRLLGSEGPQAVTMVRVAAEAEVSVGAIQHFFRDRNDLLRSAYEDGLTSMLTAVDARVEAGEAAGESIATMMRACLELLLPLDEPRRLDHAVRQCLVTEALFDPRLADAATRAADGLHRRVAAAVGNGTLCGEVERDIDVDDAAARMLACVQGLAVATGVGASSAGPDRAGRVLGAVVSSVFTGRCERHDPT